jgi:hypothetical protein
VLPTGGMKITSPGMQAYIGRGIAVQQQVVEIQPLHQPAVALQLDVAQRPDRLHAAAREQRVGDRGESAHRIGTRPLGLAEHEHANRAQVAHARRPPVVPIICSVTRASMPLLDVLEAHATHGDGPELGEH